MHRSTLRASESSPEGFRAYLEGLKAALSLREVAGQFTPLDAKGRGRCPFPDHPDLHPSFSVSEDLGLCRCFGCDRGGDAIDLVQLATGAGFWEAVRSLSDRAGLPPFRDETGPWRELRRSTSILRETAAFYRRHLDDEAARGFVRDRGLSDDSLGRFSVGYGAPGLVGHLNALGYSTDECVQTGVLSHSTAGPLDRMAGRLVFPNVIAGDVVHLSGRLIDGAGPKWLHSPGPIKHLYNAASLRGADEIVVVEGPLDCLALAQLGLSCVALYGTGNTRLLLETEGIQARDLYLALDGDEAGREASWSLAEHLGLRGRVVLLPEGLDPSDLVRAGRDREELQSLMDSSESWVEKRARELSELEVARRASGLESLARSSLPYPTAERALVRELVCDKYQLVRRRDWDRILKEHEPQVPEQTASVPAQSEPPEMTDEERSEAIALLEDERLLEILLDDLDDLGFVGEEDNKTTMFLALTSRLLDKPISITVKGESSAGKSHLAATVAKLIPPEDVYEFTAMSDRALFHFPESLSHKVLIIYERPGTENCDYLLRSLQSEDRLRYIVSVKDPETNRYVAEEIEVPGPVCFIQTTTEARIHDENETRSFDISVDETEAQTMRILERQRDTLVNGLVDPEPIIQKWRNAQRLLQRYAVRVPFAKLCQFPSDRVRARRDQIRFLALIEVIALMKQRQRRRVVLNDVEYIEATIGDYEVAYELAPKLLMPTVKGHTEKCEQLIAATWPNAHHSMTAHEMSELPLKKRAELQDATGWSRTTVERYAQEASNVGLLEVDRDGRAYLYRLRRLPLDTDSRLLPPAELQRLWAAEIQRLPEPVQPAKGTSNDLFATA